MNNQMFKSIRLYRDETQSEFAAFLGISESSVAGIEVRNRPVTDRIRARLAHRFEVTPDFIEFVERNDKLSM